MTCELPIQHSGDLRAQWYDLCLEDGGRFSANYIRTPMNIQAAYGIIPGLVGHGCHPGYRCWVDEICKDLWKPKTENELKAPTPVLAAAEFGPGKKLSISVDTNIQSPISYSTVLIVGVTSLKL